MQMAEEVMGLFPEAKYNDVSKILSVTPTTSKSLQRLPGAILFFVIVHLPLHAMQHVYNPCLAYVFQINSEMIQPSLQLPS